MVILIYEAETLNVREILEDGDYWDGDFQHNSGRAMSSD